MQRASRHVIRVETTSASYALFVVAALSSIATAEVCPFAEFSAGTPDILATCDGAWSASEGRMDLADPFVRICSGSSHSLGNSSNDVSYLCQLLR